MAKSKTLDTTGESLMRVYHKGRLIVEQHVDGNEEVLQHWQDGVLIVEVQPEAADE